MINFLFYFAFRLIVLEITYKRKKKVNNDWLGSMNSVPVPAGLEKKTVKRKAVKATETIGARTVSWNSVNPLFLLAFVFL